MTHNHVSRAKHAAVRAEQHANGLIDEAQASFESLRAQAKARGQELLRTVKSRGGELLDQAQDRGQQAIKDSREWISENPVQAVGIAFAVGVVAHAWFSRRDD